MSTASSFFGGGGATIKSIQRGVINATAVGVTATITAVNPAKTELRYLGGSVLDGGGFNYSARVVLTNSTTITATASGNIVPTSWELTEYN